jgi:3-deoxy-D-manno-octulosonate 8-phosphate phosphatase (KDO 8-P phosphatase)
MSGTIRLLVMDVDGVLTDGSIVYDDEGRQIKRFNVRDGLGINVWLKLGREAAVLSARRSEAVELRMAELGVTRVVQGARDKGEAIERLCTEAGIGLEETAFIGDDLPDLRAMRRVAYTMAPADAEARVREAAAFVTTARGGRGCVREAIMHLLDREGLMERALSQYD